MARSSRFPFYIAGLAALAAAAPAQASRSDDARAVSDAKWGAPCGGTQVTVARGDLPSAPGENRRLANASYQWTGHADNAPSYRNCKITFRRGKIATPQFCSGRVHEGGHLAGWRARPGQEYVREDGTLDRHHSANRRSIMFPRYVRPYAGCRRAASVRADDATTARSGVTVIVLSGGGFINSSAAMMKPWVDDFHAHGIRAFAMDYPTRDPLAAYAAVKARADQITGPVIVYGISAGGVIAAYLAADGAVDGGVNVVGPTDFEHWLSPTGMDIMPRIGLHTREQKRAASPLWRLNGQQTAQLVQCGVADPIVNVIEQCQRYVNAAKRGNADTRLQIMANAHGQSPADRAVARRWIQARWPRPL